MGDPVDSVQNEAGFRFYQWVPESGDPINLLSVTTIRKVCGEPFNLVQWQIANVIDVVMGQRAVTITGPRGGKRKERVAEEYPSTFARKYAEAGPNGLDDLRRWLRETADQPRNVAALRGSLVHEAIENRIRSSRISRDWVEAAFSRMSAKDRKRAKDGVTDEDVDFVRQAVQQYEDMRERVPFVILGREAQVFNLTAGYAGSADTIAWFLPEGLDPKMIRPEFVTAAYIRKVGGHVAVLDWKTSNDVYTDQVVQVHAYLAGEFVARQGVIDTRLTEILRMGMRGGLVHIRPDGWAIHFFDITPRVLRAFLGSVAFARLLVEHPSPVDLFDQTLSGRTE